MSIIDAVAKRLNCLLIERGWSTYKLARITGLTTNCIQLILQRTSKNIKLTTIIMLANAFGMTAAEFLSDDDFNYENLNIDY